MARDNHNANGSELVTGLRPESLTGPAIPEGGEVEWIDDHPKYSMSPRTASFWGPSTEEAA